MNSVAPILDQQFSAAELHALLSHPDAQVRSLADWAREFRGLGTRGLLPSEYAANQYEQQLRARLDRMNGQVYLHYEPYVGWWLIREIGGRRFLPGASTRLSDADAQHLRMSGTEIR